MSSPREAAIVAGGRTAIGHPDGPPSTPIAIEPGAAAIRAGFGQNPARQSSIPAGIGRDVNAPTLNKVYVSGLAAISDAAPLILVGDADVVLAGGHVSMSQARHLLPGSRTGWTYANIISIDSVANDVPTDSFGGNPVGVRTERHNPAPGRTCLGQVEVAAASDHRAAAAAGIAGDSSPLSDGAAALILASRQYAQAHGLEVPSTIDASGSVAGQDNSLHSQPLHAIAASLDTRAWATTKLEVIEINEAFDAVACQPPKARHCPLPKVSIRGGAIALRHPIGASGARPALSAVMESKRRGAASGRSNRAAADSAVRRCWAARSRRW